jgi:hypothetical protein
VKLLPEYCVNIVVAVVYRGRWTWLVTPKDHWLLDYRRLRNEFMKLESDLSADDDGIPDEHPERFGIEVLDETTIGDYLAQASEYVVTTAELAALFREYLAAGRNRDLTEMPPGLLVDFDARRLVDDLPEPSGPFEECVPPGWSGECDSFLAKVPDEHRYWVIDGRDYAPPTRTTTRAARILQWMLAAEVAGLVVAVVGAFVNLQENRPIADRFGAVATMAIGAFFMTAPILSAVHYGTAELAIVGRITKHSHPILYWVPIGLIVAVGMAVVVGGVVAFCR